MAEETGHTVQLYIYDLTNGLASILAPSIIGRPVEGVWHTSIVVYGKEYFYGASGIASCSPGTTQLREPKRVEHLGETFVPQALFMEYLQGLATTTYTGSAYNLLEHNCNHFSEEVSQFLCGAHIPKDVLHQPDMLPAPYRAAIAAALGSLAPSDAQNVYQNGVRQSRRDSPDFLTLNTQIEEASPAPSSLNLRMRGVASLVATLQKAVQFLKSLRRRLPSLPEGAQSAELEQRRSTLADKLARKERRKEKKRRKLQRENGDVDTDDNDMAEAVETVAHEELSLAGPSSEALELEADEKRQEEQLKKNRHPPIVYKDIDGLQEFEKLTKALEGVELSAEEKQSLEELQQYLHGEGSWVLGDEFLLFIGRLLSDSSLSSEIRVAVLKCLGAAALRDDISLLLHQDRRQHSLLNYAHEIDRHPIEEQKALAFTMCNLFENISSSEWLLYISEWEHKGRPLSNIRTTTKVCVHSLLSEEGALREAGTALLHNIAAKERFQVGKQLRALLPKQAKSKVFDEVCVELCMAALQLLSLAPGEEHLHRALGALARLAAHAPDVPLLIAAVGPAPTTYRGTSQRVDEQIDAIMKRIK